MAPRHCALGRIDQNRGKNGTEHSLRAQLMFSRIGFAAFPDLPIYNLSSIAVEDGGARSADLMQGCIGVSGLCIKWRRDRRVLKSVRLSGSKEIWQLENRLVHIVGAKSQHGALRRHIGRGAGGDVAGR